MGIKKGEEEVEGLGRAVRGSRLGLGFTIDKDLAVKGRKRQLIGNC